MQWEGTSVIFKNIKIVVYRNMSWFAEHFEPHPVRETSIDDVVLVFKHTTGHETTIKDVMNCLERANIKLNGGFKNDYHIPYRCKSHQLVSVGVNAGPRVATKRSEIVVETIEIIRNRNDGPINAQAARQALVDADMILAEEADDFTFKSIVGTPIVDVIPDY